MEIEIELRARFNGERRHPLLGNGHRATGDRVGSTFKPPDRKLRGISSDALRAASGLGEFIAFGQSHTLFSVIGGRSVSFLRDAPGMVPPSCRRSGCSPAWPYPPARRLKLFAGRGGSQPSGLGFFLKKR
jgi:hypothetical protein